MLTLILAIVFGPLVLCGILWAILIPLTVLANALETINKNWSK